VIGLVASPHERAQLSELTRAKPGGWDRLLFCAKEAVYKAWYPLTRQWLSFDDRRAPIAVAYRWYEP
jgi:4'-phosphopantetheinyl transferase EntD